MYSKDTHTLQKSFSPRFKSRSLLLLKNAYVWLKSQNISKEEVWWTDKQATP